ncbi:MAG: class I SAM-dependent methyltransferase, partial [Caulobacteraceae bacterium]
GFDVADAQVETARRMAADLAALPGMELTFDVGDLSGPLPEADASVDIVLCLYSVLSHLPFEDLPQVAAEMARVTRRHFITTVRAAGSPPTIFVDSVDKARHFQHDHVHDQCEVELRNGRFFAMKFHLFDAAELQGCFARHFVIEDLRGLDLFHSRFAPDSRWNPPSLPADRGFYDHLERLEETYARTFGFMERATHLLLVGRREG